MQHRVMGRTGERVTALGFGCMRLPVMNNDDGCIDEPQATDLLREAIDAGVNYVDTAYPYHKEASEPFLGRALQEGYREKVYLASKLPSWAIQTHEDCDRYLNEQLQRLQTDCIDFYLLHALKKEWWHKLQNLGVLDFLDRAVADGRIRYVGFSFHDEWPQFKEIVDAYDWDFCQIQYNYMDEDIQAGSKGLYYAANKGMGVVVMEPLRGGSLANTVPPAVQAVWDEAPPYRTPAEWALRWVWDHPEVSVVLSGMNEPEQLAENCRVAEEATPGSLTTEDHERIARVRQIYRERIQIPCTACGYCMPCPYGVNIPRIFSILNDRFIYDAAHWSTMMYNVATNSDENAANCIQCGTCEELCPQQIPIMQKLQECHAQLAMAETPE
ncbi:MAG: aldo/keto reductase [Desulfohalobium sp.]